MKWLSLLAVSLLGACVVHVNDSGDWNDWQYRENKNRNYVAHLALGVRREAVLADLGSPDFSEAYAHDGHDYTVLFYRTQHQHGDGETTRDETTPLVFENDVLTGWGGQAYEEAR